MLSEQDNIIKASEPYSTGQPYSENFSQDQQNIPVRNACAANAAQNRQVDNFVFNSDFPLDFATFLTFLERSFFSPSLYPRSMGYYISPFSNMIKNILQLLLQQVLSLCVYSIVSKALQRPRRPSMLLASKNAGPWPGSAHLKSEKANQKEPLRTGERACPSRPCDAAMVGSSGQATR